MTNEWATNDFTAPAQPDGSPPLGGSPHSVRPETHWLYETGHGCRSDGPLWFSLQLSLETARGLHDAFAEPNPGLPFKALIDKGARMSPASHAALGLAIALKRERIGADILVPQGAFGALKKLADDHGADIEISDAGLAIDHEPGDGTGQHTPLSHSLPQSEVGDGQPGPVIVAIIDDGIGIANHRFRKDQNETRIEHFLDLSLPHDTTGPGTELLARNWTGAQINALLASNDEERVYRKLGLIDPGRKGRQPLRAAVSHGTHVLDTAAGYDWQKAKKAQAERSSEYDELVNRPIIAVQLPTQVAENRSDAWMPQSLKRALDWILIKADKLSKERGGGRRLPLIVNCSVGSMAGPQNGQSDVERRITQFVETYRGGSDSRQKGLCTVVLSAGNSLQLRSAARLSLKPQEQVSLPWRVLPDDKTPSFVQIWLPESDSKREQQVAVSLVPPRTAPPEKWSTLNTALDWKLNDVVHARLYHRGWWISKGKWQECITIAIRPTADDGEPEPLVPAGLWCIKVKAEGGPLADQIDIDLRIHRDDAGMFARGKGRQPYFDEPRYERYDPIAGRPANDERTDSDEPGQDGEPAPDGDPGAHHGSDERPGPGQPRRRRAHSPVSMQGTLNAYGHGEGTLLVAGYRDSDNEPAAYSSAAMRRPRGRRRSGGGTGLAAPGLGPSPASRRMIAAVTEESPAFRGILGAGTYSGSVTSLNGTSVAAPLATRALADIVARGSSQDPVTQLKLIEDGNHPLRFGKGRLPFKTSYKRRIDP